ncbi:hypothetical protein AP75_01425 [Kaistella haifensis DSM 19056]|uniref:Uncharacterized protein n=1 Tax=Kaistella haifensis DSM 19056 TaxID=1450526 RepID=A0A246BBV5_9FLAO|nr:hypothetical protein [Kaistella haifensis]OWK99174.1 hypothetical protein AP75_01425 [Kaistella haifensis DSM 19056]
MEEVLDIINKFFKEKVWDKILIEINFTEAGGYEPQLTVIKGEEKSLWGEFELFDIADIIHKRQKGLLNTSEKFNKAKIEIYPDGTFLEHYWWDSGLQKQNLLNYAQVFYQWANDRMMSMIFEFEKDNNLLPTQYDGDGDLEYLSSWDSGVFTFHINDKNELEYKIILTKDGKERILEMPLKDYFIEGILEHHKITNTELSDEWKPWNTMVLKSPHNDIPYDKRDEFVSYILE